MHATGPRGSHQAVATSAPGQPARPRTLGTIRLRGAGVGPWARGATRPASCRPLRLGPPCGWPAPPRWPRSCWRPTSERPKDRRRARPRQQSSPDRTATEEPVITMIFQNRCWVFGPGVEFTGKGGEEPLSGEEGRRLLLSAPQLAARVPGLRGVMRWDRRSSFSGKGGPNDGWLTSTANSGSGPASLVRRLASISLRPALRVSERNNDLRRGPDLLSFYAPGVGVSP